MKINKKYSILLTLLVSVVIILLFFSIIQNFSLNNKFKKQNDRILTLIDDERKKTDILENNIQIINSNNNEIRTILSLPPVILDHEENEDIQEITNINDSNILFYNAIDYFTLHSDIVKSEIMLNSLITSSEFKNFLNNNKLSINRTDSSTYSIKDNNNKYFIITVDDPVKKTIIIENIFNQKQTFNLNDIDKNNSEYYNYLNSELQKIKSHYKTYLTLSDELEKLLQSSSFTTILKKYNLNLSSKELSDNGLFYYISNKDSSFTKKVLLDKGNLTFFIDKKEYKSISELKNGIKKTIEESDTRTEEIRVVDNQKNKIEEILSDDAFKAYLEKNKFTVNTTPREDNDYFYYDIRNLSGNLIGSFGVQKIIGDIYLLDSEDIMISSLKLLENKNNDEIKVPEMKIPENISLIADKYEKDNSTTFVVIGSHENNADTIIIVHADSSTGKTTLVAIPRDLYYQERKINDYYRSFGGPKFVEILSDITGLSISGYIAVDMYAFIDLINILGGIDVYLKSDLIDPTYMVRDNGKWSTLYYEKGIHHLNGIEALRITRSRHTSSDFGRTARQQLVLQGIKDKMTDLDITDLGTVLKLFQTLDNYMETNFTPVEMLGLFMKYRNTELVKKQGLSVFNVLYNTYTNIYKLEDKSKQYEEGFYRGYWILLPKNDDWNVIKWYIRTLIDGEVK